MSGNEPVNTLPDSNVSTFRSSSRESWREEIPDIFSRYIPEGWVRSGGLHSTSANKIATAISCEAFTSSGNRVTADGAGGSVAINYGTLGAVSDDIAWVIISAESGNTLTNFQRFSTSNYFVNVTDVTQPSLPTNSAWLMKVTIAGGAITAVGDMRKPNSYATRKVYDITDPLYGAVADSTLSSSSRTAIQNCFNASYYGNKTVFIPAGIYWVGNNVGSTKIIDLSSLGDGISILTSGFVELVNTTNVTGNQIARIFYLANNSHFYCDPIAFRDSNYDWTVTNQGAIGFYIQNATPANWGNLYFSKVYATTMTAPFNIVQKTGASATEVYRISGIYIGECICNDTYYGFNCQNDGDNIIVGLLQGTQCRRVYYVYGVQHHKVSIMDINPRGSTGKCYIARQASGLNTSDLDITYASRYYDQGPSGSMVVIDHIDLLGGIISNIKVRVDVRNSASSYYPVYFRNYDGSGGSVDPTTPANYVRDIHLSGSCDANALDCYVAATYAGKGQMNFISGYNFLPQATTLLTQFQLNQLARSQTGLTWGSSGTAPALGNGALVYDIDITNGILFLNIKLTIGSTSTMGTGSWTFSGYSPALKSATDVIGTIICVDLASRWWTGVCKIQRNGTNIAVLVDDNSNGVGPTIPFTWATGDYLIASIAFPISSLD